MHAMHGMININISKKGIPSKEMWVSKLIANQSRLTAVSPNDQKYDRYSLWEVLCNVYSHVLPADLKLSFAADNVVTGFYLSDNLGVINRTVTKWLGTKATHKPYITYREGTYVDARDKLFTYSYNGEFTASNISCWGLYKADLIISTTPTNTDAAGAIICAVSRSTVGKHAFIRLPIPFNNTVSTLMYLFAKLHNRVFLYVTEFGDLYLCGICLLQYVSVWKFSKYLRDLLLTPGLSMFNAVLIPRNEANWLSKWHENLEREIDRALRAPRMIDGPFITDWSKRYGMD